MTYSTIDTTAGGQNIELLLPSNYVANAIIFHHPYAGDRTSFGSDSRMNGIRDRMMTDGYLVGSSNAGGNAWGNTTAVNAYEALRSYMVTNYAPTKIAVMSWSMGGLSGLLQASAGFTGLVGWAGIAPVCNLADLYTDYSGFKASIKTAYGITTDPQYASLTSGHDPVLLTASTFNNLPMRFWASPADVDVTKTTNSDAMATVVASSKAESTVVLCSGLHSTATQFQPQDMSDFLNRCFVARSSAWRNV